MTLLLNKLSMVIQLLILNPKNQSVNLKIDMNNKKENIN